MRGVRDDAPLLRLRSSKDVGRCSRAPNAAEAYGQDRTSITRRSVLSRLGQRGYLIARGALPMPPQIAYVLKSPSDRPLQATARGAFAAYLRHRLIVRVVDNEDVLSAPGLDLEACVADALRRFDKSTAISDLLKLEDLDGTAYVLEGSANAIVYRERRARLRRMTSAGRPPKAWAMLTSCHWTLTELDPHDRRRLLSRLIEDFLDESPSTETLRNQINQAEIRMAERQRLRGLPHVRLTADFRCLV